MEALTKIAAQYLDGYFFRPYLPSRTVVHTLEVSKNDSIKISIDYAPKMSKKFLFTDTLQKISINLDGNPLTTKYLSLSEKKCSFIIPREVSNVKFHINPFLISKPREHIENIYPIDFFIYELQLPTNVTEIEITLPDLAYYLFFPPIDFRGEYFQILNSETIKWRDRVFIYDKEGTKIYKSCHLDELN